MSSSAVWKLEDENSFPTNCFPARGVARKLQEGAGSWVIAYAEEQQNRFQATFKPTRRVQIQTNDFENAINVQNPEKEKQELASKTLDATYLMQRHHVDSVLDLCSVNVSDRNLEYVNEDDFKKFINVAYVNAAENVLPFRPFSNFLSLRELELPVNGLRNLQVVDGDFPNLQVLDLSYNNLSAKDVLALGVLQKLKVLTLTGNGLHSIHPDMARPEVLQISESETEIFARFGNLEVLFLDDNHLSDLSTFASLAALPQLRELNLDKNGIEVIPHLKVIGDRVVSEAQSSLGQYRSVTSSSKKSRDSACTLSPKASNPPKTEEHEAEMAKSGHIFSATTVQDPTELRGFSREDVDETPDLTAGVSTPNPPFQQLRLLSIANNKIREEECVLAVAAWPRLKHIVLNGNPIVKTNSGEPPLLSHYLKERLGINIHRYQRNVAALKPRLVMPMEKDRKVRTRVPKIPKQPVDVLINSLMGPSGLQPHPPTTTPPTSPTEQRISDASKAEQPQKTASQDVVPEENVFLTQVDEVPVEPSPRQSRKSSRKKRKETLPPISPKADVDDRYKGFEVLLDAKEDRSVHETIGIQGNIRVLHHMLSHPTVFRSSEVTLDRVMPSYQTKSSRHQKAIAIAHDRKIQKYPTKPEKFKSELHKIRERKVIDVEVPLTEVLYSNQHEDIADEAEVLLEAVEEKYRVVREKSLRVSQEAQREFEETKQIVKNLTAE